MKSRPGHEFIVQWGKANAEPPEGMNRVQLRMFAESTHPLPPDVDTLLSTLGLGRGWVLCVSCVAPPARRMTAQQKGTRRRQALERRVKKTIGPLFADEVIKEQLVARTDYFQGAEVDERAAQYIRACDDADAVRWAAYQAWLRSRTSEYAQ